jgi:hypothetical protein
MMNSMQQRPHSAADAFVGCYAAEHVHPREECNCKLATEHTGCVDNHPDQAHEVHV